MVAYQEDAVMIEIPVPPVFFERREAGTPVSEMLTPDGAYVEDDAYVHDDGTQALTREQYDAGVRA